MFDQQLVCRGALFPLWASNLHAFPERFPSKAFKTNAQCTTTIQTSYKGQHIRNNYTETDKNRVNKTSRVRSWNDDNTFVCLLPLSRGHRVQSMECVEDSLWLFDYRTCCISTVEKKTLIKELLLRSPLEMCWWGYLAVVNHSRSRNRDALASVFSQSGKWP